VNRQVRSADDYEAGIRRLFRSCHIGLTVCKFGSGTGGQAAIDGQLRPRSRQAYVRIGVQQSGASVWYFDCTRVRPR
jgi:hypothetical protein